jgi:hypothetical protein
MDDIGLSLESSKLSASELFVVTATVGGELCDPFCSLGCNGV